MTNTPEWTNVLEQLRETSSTVQYTTWFKPMKPIMIDQDHMLILVHDNFSVSVLKQRYFLMVKNAIAISFGREIEIDFSTESSMPMQTMQSARPAKEEIPELMLNPKYTFDSFVIGASNRFAHAASLAVAELPADAYNPLFLYGGVGLGKTHLMHAIGHHIHANNPSARLLYITSEKFTTMLIDAISKKTNQEYQYRRHKQDRCRGDYARGSFGALDGEGILNLLLIHHTDGVQKLILIHSRIPPCVMYRQVFCGCGKAWI